MVELPAAPLRCLSLWNPWAWALFRRGKDVENRDWNSRFRGWVAVQVSKHWEPREFDQLVAAVNAAAPSLPKISAANIDEMHLQRGHIIGLIRIDDWKRSCEYASPWAFTEGYGAHVAEVIEIQPVECRGMPGLFSPPVHVDLKVWTNLSKTGAVTCRA